MFYVFVTASLSGEDLIQAGNDYVGILDAGCRGLGPSSIRLALHRVLRAIPARK